MRQPRSVRALEDFGRIRLSENFFMRDFLYSEIAAINGFPNLPEDPDLAIAAGRQLCENLLEPLQTRFGRISVRSAYRSQEVNGFGNANKLTLRQRSIYASMVLAKMADTYHAYADLLHEKLTSCLSADVFLGINPGTL